MILVACDGATENEEDTGIDENGVTENGEEKISNEDAEESEYGGKLTLVYVKRDSEVASHHVLKKVLEDQGFEVELLVVDDAQLWQRVAEGNADATAAAWLPFTHAAQYNEYGDRVVDLGSNLNGVKIGMVVPVYVDISSIAEVDANAEQFDGDIIGIEQGTGVIAATEDAIEHYGMRNMALMTNSDAGMVAELQESYENEEWIVITGWTPHWMFSKFNLKFLEDPDGIYGKAEAIHTMAREGLEEDMPEAYSILDNFFWETSDMESVMLDIEDGMDPEVAAAKWVEQNQDKVQEWVSE